MGVVLGIVLVVFGEDMLEGLKEGGFLVPDECVFGLDFS